MSRITNVPNGLTALRLLVLPLTIMLFRSGYFFWSAFCFSATMLLDCVDGWVARRWDQRTRLGTYLDPMVDKITVLALFYELAGEWLIPPAVAHLFLAREVLHDGVRTVAASRGAVVGANWMGKTKTALQTTTIIWGLLLPWLRLEATDATYSILQAGLTTAAWSTLLIAWCFFVVFLWWNRQYVLREP